jgi:hypothetical protein
LLAMRRAYVSRKWKGAGDTSLPDVRCDVSALSNVVWIA